MDEEVSVLKQISARLKTSSAVVPAILVALISMPIGAAGLISHRGNELVFTFVLLLPLIVVLGQIIIFTLVDRDRLHNEEHIERRMQIDSGRSVIVDNNTNREILIEGRSTSPDEDSEGRQ